jgi:hypothetical protein
MTRYDPLMETSAPAVRALKMEIIYFSNQCIVPVNVLTQNRHVGLYLGLHDDT